jgi:hypothetical protein
VTTVSPAELAARTRARSMVCIDAETAEEFLREWAEQDVTEEIDGRWRLTRRGRVLLAGWPIAIDLDDDVAA